MYNHISLFLYVYVIVSLFMTRKKWVWKGPFSGYVVTGVGCWFVGSVLDREAMNDDNADGQ